MKTLIIPFLLFSSLAIGSPFSVSKTHESLTPDAREMRIAGTGEVIYVANQPILTSDDAVDARFYKQDGRIYVTVVLSQEGRSKFERASGESIERRLAIVVADELISAPRVMQKISTESLQITGLSEDKAKKLVAILKRK